MPRYTYPDNKILGLRGFINDVSVTFTQPTFTSSKLTIETLGQDMKYVQS